MATRGVVTNGSVDVFQCLDLGAESLGKSSGRLKGDVVESASPILGAVRPQRDVPVDERLEDCTRVLSLVAEEPKGDTGWPAVSVPCAGCTLLRWHEQLLVQ